MTTRTDGGAIFERVYAWVLQIPPGRVMTYGQISRLLRERLSARAVGWALRACPHDDRRIPWHRVVNAQGGISTDRLLTHAPGLQQALLEAEGIVFNDRGRLELGRYQWLPENPDDKDGEAG